MSPRGEKDNKKNNNNKTQNIKKKKLEIPCFVIFN